MSIKKNPENSESSRRSLPGQRPGFKLFLFSLIVAFLVFYICLQSRIYNFDGMVYALQLKAASEGNGTLMLYSPYHMLYLPAAFGIFKAARASGIVTDPLSFLRIFNLIIGLLSIAIFYSFCNKRFKSASASVFAAFLYASSFSVWFMSHESETYILSVAIILLLFSALFDFRSENFDGFKGLIVGFLFGLAVLSHITAILLVFPVVYYILKKSSRKLKDLLVTMSIAGFVISSQYLLFYLRSPFKGLKDFLSWFFQAVSYQQIYGGEVNFWEIGTASVLKTFVSTFDSIVSKFNYLKLNTDLFLGFRIVLAFAFSICLFLLIKKWRTMKGMDVFFLKVSLLWIIPLTIFYTFWGTSHFKFRIIVLPAIIILLTVSIFNIPERKAGRKKIAVVILAVSVFAFNSFVSIIPATGEKINPDLQKALWIKEVTPLSSSIIILGLENRGYEFGKVYINYFSERNVIIMSWFIRQSRKGHYEISDYLRRIAESGRNLFALNEVFDDFDGKKILLQRSDIHSEDEFDKFFTGFKHVPWKEISREFFLYKLSLKED
jgi:4-amino-4-deoxy-L-arabinose transferase-like glycosyltransferase